VVVLAERQVGGELPGVAAVVADADAAVLAEARRLGIAARPGCSIVDIGRRPGDFPN